MSSLRERVEGLVAKLKPLLEKATPRPWLIKPTRIGKLVWEQRNPHGEASSWVSMIRADDPENANFAIVCELDFGYGRKTQEADAELIVAAVNAISELAAALAAEGSQAPIQELEKLRQSWDELADRLDRQYSFDFRCGVQRCEAELGLLIKALTAEAAAPSLHKEASRCNCDVTDGAHCPVHRDEYAKVPGRAETHSEERKASQSDDNADSSLVPALHKEGAQGKHICCWERENPHRCILCCQCGKKFEPPAGAGLREALLSIIDACDSHSGADKLTIFNIANRALAATDAPKETKP